MIIVNTVSVTAPLFIYVPSLGQIPLESTGTTTIISPAWLWQKRREGRNQNFQIWNKEYKKTYIMFREILLEKLIK